MGSNESIAHSHDGLDEPGIVRVVVEQVAKLSDGGVDTSFCVDKYARGPELLGNFTARDQLPFTGTQAG